MRASSFTALLVLSLLSAIPSHAQTAADVNEGSRLTPDAAAGAFTFSWWGRSGRTYFIQTSENLVTWTYVPVIESGAGTVIAWNFTSTGGRYFLRLRHTDAPTGGNPDTADFDGDSLTNWQEIFQFHTDPHSSDSDGDSYSDSAEIMNGTDPNDPLNFPTGQLPGTQAENGLVEAYPILFAQRKYVEDHWAIPSGSSYVQWSDDNGASGIEFYSSGAPKWAAKLALLTYPPGLELSETWNSLPPTAKTLLYTSSTRGILKLQRARAALISPAYMPVEPWPVTRHCFKVRTIRSSTSSGEASGASVNENLGFIPVTIPQGQRISPTMPELSVDPVDGKSIVLECSPVWFRKLYGQNYDLPDAGIDSQIYPPWKMLPAGESMMFEVNCGASTSTPIFFKATGGGVTPPMGVAVSNPDDLTFTGGANDSDDGLLTVGVGTTFSDNDPVLRFTVKKRKTLKVTVHPIGLLSATGATTLPQHLPTQASLKTQLDQIFGVQANIYSEVTIKPTKVVAWDVGVETLPGGGTPKGAGDGVLDVFYHTSPTESLYSDEELRIAAAEPSDDAANVNVFFVAAPGISIGLLNWGLALRDRLSAGQYQGYSIPLGFAGKAIPLNFNVVYVWDYPPDSSSDPNRSRPSQHGWGIAHEIGHVLGLAHCCGIGAFPPFERPNSDNESRLMTGRSGKKRFDNPRVLIKEEWDVIHNSTNLHTP